MRRLLAFTVLVGALLSVLAPARASHENGALPGEFMGMVVRDPHYEWQTNPLYPGVNEAFFEEMGRNLQAAGVKWIRIEFRAEDEASSLPGGVRTEQYRYLIDTVAPKYGFKVLALLATQLARYPDGPNVGRYIDPEEIETPGDGRQCGVYGCATNDYMRVWLDNAFTIASAFPYDATTGRGIAAYEVMNEENRFIGGNGKGLKPESVAILTTKFYRVFRQGGPDEARRIGPWGDDVRIILGGLHPNRCDDCITDTGSRMTDREYLDAVYKSPAFQWFRTTYPAVGYPIDGVGYHPYPMEMRYGLLPEPTGYDDLFRIPERIQAIRNVMLANGDGENKIWVTEIGDRGAPGDLDNQQRQAAFLRSAYWMLWQQRDSISTVFWFKYEDFAVTEGSENWGVVRLGHRVPTPDCLACEYAADGTVDVYKQSFFAYQQMSRFGIGLETYHVRFPMILR